jgi:ribose 5-phosphate isomerase B
MPAVLKDLIVYIAADHAGFALKTSLIKKYPEIRWKDLGTASEDSVDYPDYADRVIAAMHEHLKQQPAKENPVGVLICGSGQGMAIRANRFSSVRAALCWSEEIARLARAHNNANVLCLPGKHVDPAIAEKILTTFLTTSFEGGRHERRVAKLAAPTSDPGSNRSPSRQNY